MHTLFREVHFFLIEIFLTVHPIYIDIKHEETQTMDKEQGGN